MRLQILIIPAIACALSINTNAQAADAVFDFEGVAVGTTYGGADGHTPGDVVLMEDNIVMSVEAFASTAGEVFGQAMVGGDYMSFFESVPLQMNNIGTKFDFTGLDDPVGILRFAYRDFGGTVDFTINDGTRYVLDDLTKIPLSPEPGFDVVVAPPEGGFAGFGIVTIYGAGLETLQIGGQELVIDRVLATTVPEPATAVLMLMGVGATMYRRRK
ncbi:MAG: PEP-CTERM sorting domain-containing protein [Phycisphaerae bacterium]